LFAGEIDISSVTSWVPYRILLYSSSAALKPLAHAVIDQGGLTTTKSKVFRLPLFFQNPRVMLSLQHPRVMFNGGAKMATPEKKSTSTIKKSLDSPEEVRPIDKGRVEVVNLGDVTAMRATLEPGWKWSESVKPIAGTNSCEVAHMGYMVSGRMMIRMDDGSQQEFRPGDVGVISPGHDAWVVGNERVVFIDFQGGSTFAKPRG
jgi:hypothetical protein